MAINAALNVLNARLLLLVSMLVGGYLAYLTVSDPNAYRLAALGVFELGVFAPLCVLSWFRG